MAKRQFKPQASSSRATLGTGFGAFVTGTGGSSLSFLSEPPNLSSISDANVVVAFKNLLKKDSTTKAKGLEDLITFVQGHPYEKNGGVELSILEAWVALYPRVSIDNSRRVRELSHNLQYELLMSARKRTEKYVPSVVGAWLAGTYDRDRLVSKAANNGIKSFLDTEDKVLSFWRRCQAQILAYAQEAIEETPQTLSDERTVSSDDSQAKYDRVIGACLSLVLNLLIKLNDADIRKYQEAYSNFLSNNKTLWSFATSGDSFVRKTTSQLLVVCLDKQEEIIKMDLELISHVFISEALHGLQLGSALQLLQALAKLTSQFPQAWTSAYKGKKPPLSRLRSFAEKGSQGGPPEFWGVLSTLFTRLPSGILPNDLDGATDFLKTLRDGISSRGETRTNAPTAWTSYFEIARHLGVGLPDSESFNLLVLNAVFPVFEQFMRPVAENSRWSVGNSSTALVRAFKLFSSSESYQILSDEWRRLSGLLISSISLSHPEQLNDYTKSQTAVVAEAHRWFGLQAEIIKCVAEDNQNTPFSAINIMVEPCSSVIKNSLDILVKRNGKTYCAAGTLEAALRLTPTLVMNSSGTLDTISSFLKTDLPKLITSPSSKYLVASLDAFCLVQGGDEVYKKSWEAAIAELVATPDGAQNSIAIQTLISTHKASSLAQQNASLQSYLLNYISIAMRGESQDSTLFEIAIIYNALSGDTCDQLVEMILNSLDSELVGGDHVLRALDIICQRRPQLFQQEQVVHLRVITRLLALTESANPDTKVLASELKNKLETASHPKLQSSQMQSPLLSIIKENLETAGPASLAVDTLVGQVDTLLDDADSTVIANLFPDTERWSEVLYLALHKKPDPCLSIIGPEASVSLIVHTESATLPYEPSMDLNGYSIALRMGLFTSKLLKKRRIIWELAVEQRVSILQLLCLTSQFANDALVLQEEGTLWSSLLDPEVETEIGDFVESSMTSINEILAGEPDAAESTKQDQTTTSRQLLLSLVNTSKGTSPLAFYAGRVLSKIIGYALSMSGWEDIGSEEWLSSLNTFKISTPNPITAVATLIGLNETLGKSKIVSNLCNRLVSEITDSSPNNERTLCLTILLNATLTIYELTDLPVAQNRIVFAVKNILSWMDNDPSLSLALTAEACRSLQFLLPSIEKVYGPYWQSSIDFCLALWGKAEKSPRGNDMNAWLPALHASLKLIGTLKQLQNPNDDLQEALEGSADRISAGLLRLLLLPRIKDIQPWRIFDESLWRQVVKIPSEHVKDWSMLYPLLASDFRLIQLAAFDILNKVIPAAQEQISIDVLLEKSDAQLPDELLSLLLDAPIGQDFPDDILAQFPPTIRRYLFAWLLVFASYSKASYKVRSDYNEILKSEQYLSPLLDFLFDALGHSSARPLNLDRAQLNPQQIQVYDAKSGEDLPDERNLEWLLVHLWYMCLKYAPTLAKNWWIDCKSRQMRMTVESWTERYFSPLLIEEAFNEVTMWAEHQDSSSDNEKALLIKVLKKPREVYAGYEVDEMEMQIVIRLPANYPLEGVKVDGVNRVAVSEKKWKNWLMITQSVITFSNGSITDGLNIFRKNVSGALKGQSECAICYSIVSSDRKVPETRCQTCKHLFHSSCLMKWFSNSNQSTCPLCRNTFNYSLDAASRARRRGGPEP